MSFPARGGHPTGEEHATGTDSSEHAISTLYVLRGPDAGKSYPIPRGDTTLGRSPRGRRGKPDTCICETPSYAECTEPSTPTARECCGAQQMLPHANPEESRTINHNPLFGTSHSYWGRLSAFFEPPTFQVRVLPGAQHIPLPETTLTGLRITQLSLSTTIPLSPSQSTLPNPANSSRFYSASACPSLWA